METEYPSGDAKYERPTVDGNAIGCRSYGSARTLWAIRPSNIQTKSEFTLSMAHRQQDVSTDVIGHRVNDSHGEA